MGAEAALVRPQFMSGTHTLTVALFGLLRTGDTLLAAIIRGNECIIPGGNDCVKLHDSVIAVTTKFGMQQFDDIFEE